MHTPIGIILWTPQLTYSLSVYHLVADQLNSTELNSTSTVMGMSITTDTCFIMMWSSSECLYVSKIKEVSVFQPTCHNMVKDLINALLGNSSINTFQCATVEVVSQWMNVIARC
jgi:hypothetical protein